MLIPLETTVSTCQDVHEIYNIEINTWLFHEQCFTRNDGVYGIKPQVTPDVMSNSPFVPQANTRQFGRRI